MNELNGKRVLFLVGPTAVGKSEIALALAEKVGGEIISVDSMQVYRGMDIGTAKPSPAERARVPHHLLDIRELSETFDAAQFATLAKQAIGEIQGRGRLPILCGGTGLYFKALLDGLGEAPPADAELRGQLQSTPLPELLQELAEKDPVTFARIDRQNPRRVLRAVEVFRLTGRPFSGQRATWGDSSSRSGHAVPVFGVSRASGDLHRRIESRVDEMFRRGLVAETQALLAQGLDRNVTASQALGYRQVLEHLRQLRSLPDTIQLVKIRTRQFAKRQMTWFRRQLPVTWIPVDENGDLALIAERLAGEMLQAHAG